MKFVWVFFVLILHLDTIVCLVILRKWFILFFSILLFQCFFFFLNSVEKNLIKFKGYFKLFIYNKS